MSKLTLSDVINLQNENTAVGTINANKNTIVTAFDNTLSRDGTSPNSMGADLDMNSHRILNLPLPVNLSEPARLQDIGNAPGYAAQALTSANNAAGSASAAATSASSAGTSATAAAASATAAANSAASTGISGLTNHGIPVANTTTSLNTSLILTNGQLVVGATGANPTVQSVSGDATLSAAGALTVTKTNGTSFASSATTDTTNASNISSGTLNINRVDASYSRGFISGLNMSGGGSTTLTINAGVSCSDDFTTLMKQTSNYTKTFAAWTVGTAAGGLDTGAIAANTWYAVYQIIRPDTGVVDYLISASFSAPTMPTNYTKKRRIGAIKTDATPNIIKFFQQGDRFIFDVGNYGLDVNGTNAPTASRTLVTLGACPPIITRGIVRVNYTNPGSATINLILTDPAQTDTAAAGTNATLTIGSTVAGVINLSGYGEIRTNSSGQIGYRGDTAAAVTLISMGFVDRRGQDD